MVSAIISRLVILVFGTLYPAYASYKAVRTKNVKEYVKWMMYWIVFALFTCIETFSDVLLSWLPFYYEVKIVFVLWMLSPMTKGSSFLFKKFVHPSLARREKDIDEMIAQAQNQSYRTLLSLGTRGLTYASKVVVQTALMGQTKLVDHLRRSYSTSDLSNDGGHLVSRHRPLDEDDDGEDELDNRLLEDNAELEMRSTHSKRVTRSASTGGTMAVSRKALHSVKEVDEDDEEVVTITEEYTYNVPTRVYSPKEGELHDDSGVSTHSSESLSSAIAPISPTSSPTRGRYARSGSWSSTPGESGGSRSGSTSELWKSYRSGSLSSSSSSSLISASAAAFLERYRHPSGLGSGSRTSSLSSWGSSTSPISTSSSSSALPSSPSSSLGLSTLSRSSSLGFGSSSGYSTEELARRRRWGSWSSPGSRSHYTSKH